MQNHIIGHFDNLCNCGKLLEVDHFSKLHIELLRSRKFSFFSSRYVQKGIIHRTLQLNSFQTLSIFKESPLCIQLVVGSLSTYSLMLIIFSCLKDRNVFEIMQIVLFLASTFVFMLTHMNQFKIQKQLQYQCSISQIGIPKSDSNHFIFPKRDQVIQQQNICQNQAHKIINNLNIIQYNQINQETPQLHNKMVDSPDSSSQDSNSQQLHYKTTNDYFSTLNQVFKNSPIGTAIIDVSCKPYMFNEAFSFQTSTKIKSNIQNLLGNIKIIKLDKFSHNQFKNSQRDKQQDDVSQKGSIVVEKNRFSDWQSDKRYQTNDSQLFNSIKSNKTFSELLREFELSCKSDPDRFQEGLCILDFESSAIDPNKTLIHLSQDHNINTEFNRLNSNNEASMYFVVYLINVEDKQKHSQKKATLNIMNQLFRSFSHEFSTSLNGIQALAQAAEDDLSRNRRIIELYINPILNSCGIMNSIVQDVRDFSMLLSKSFMIKIEYLSIQAIVEQIHQLFSKQFQMRNIEFIYHQDECIQMISTDFTRLKQILVNLFSNAQKHTSDGPIRVEVKEVRVHELKYLRISVEDSGCGMETEDQERLSRILENELSAQDNNYKNFGIGLLISNQLALILSKLKRNSGGGIYYTSALNQGSKFWFLVADQQNEILNDTPKSNYHPTRQSPMIQVGKNTLVCRQSNSNIPTSGPEKKFTYIYPYDKKQQKNNKKQSYRTAQSKQSQSQLDFSQKNSILDLPENLFLTQLSQELRKDNSQKSVKLSRKTFFGKQIDEEKSFLGKKIDEEKSSANQSFEIDEFKRTEVRNFHLPPQIPMKHPEQSHKQQASDEYKLCPCTRVIIIDDEYINIFALQMLLQTFDLKSDSAYNGIEGVEKVLQKFQNPCNNCNATYNLILMDIDMPGLNGFEATKRIVSFCDLTLTKKPIIVAQTAYVDSQTQNRCFAVGMNHFLGKPIHKAELKNALLFFEMM